MRSRRPGNKRENVDGQRRRGMPLSGDHSILHSGSMVPLCSRAQLAVWETTAPHLQKQTSAHRPPLYFEIQLEHSDLYDTQREQWKGRFTTLSANVTLTDQNHIQEAGVSLSETTILRRLHEQKHRGYTATC